MSLPRIYCSENLIMGQEVFLNAQASRHLLKVLRLRAQDHVILFNGRGGEFVGTLCFSDKTGVVIKIEASQPGKPESPLNLHLVYGLARFEKTEWVIQKATELGVSKISLVMTQHGEVHLQKQAIEVRLTRWRSIIIAACEQSGRCFLPDIVSPVKFHDFIKQPQPGQKLLFHLNNTAPLLKDQNPQAATLLVGPEGGFSEEEVRLAVEQGYGVVGLGPRVLRTETAAISAVTLAQILWGDFLF